MENRQYKYDFKEKCEARFHELLPELSDFEKFKAIIHTKPRNFIRCNTLKMESSKLIEILSKRWKVVQPFSQYPEIMLIDQELNPGELGSSIEHLMGYYYIQEISSMMSCIALNPQPNEIILDLCASPGSKTTQIAAKMNNTGSLFANDFKLDRISVLAANLERCGASNSIITRMDAVTLCNRIEKTSLRFDKILLDAPCSGEGTIRSSPKTLLMWNEKVINNLSRQQKKMLANAIKILKVGGTLVYSTCTHAPEEDESVVNFASKNFPVKVEKVELPIKTRPGICSWKGEDYNQEVSNCARIYPQDNDSEGFFVSKLTLMEEIK